jgi:hypothetical protein
MLKISAPLPEFQPNEPLSVRSISMDSTFKEIELKIVTAFNVNNKESPQTYLAARSRPSASSLSSHHEENCQRGK